MVERINMPEETILKTVPRDMEVVKPEPGFLNEDQAKRAFVNFLKFSSIPAIAFLVGIQGGLSVPEAFTLCLVPALINALIDVITKWNSDTPYLRDKDTQK